MRRAATDLDVASTLPEVADTISTLGLGRGFAGQVTDEAAAMTTVYWHGELPRVVRDYLTEAEELGIQVRVADADSRFELTTLRAATSRVTGDEDLVQRAGISMASANVDGSGIKIWLSAEPGADVKEQIATTAGLPADAISYRTGIGHIVPLSGTRDDDVAPWKGGARLRFMYASQQWCSSGFAVLLGSSGRLLSAAHCDPYDNVGVTDGGGAWIAPQANVNQLSSIDSLSIDPTASPATPLKFTRGRAGTAEINPL